MVACQVIDFFLFFFIEIIDIFMHVYFQHDNSCSNMYEKMGYDLHVN